MPAAVSAAPAREPVAWPCAAQGDVDGDGTVDTIARTARGFVVRTGRGELPVPLPGPAVVRLCLGDLQGDGRAEVVAGVVRTADTDPTFRQRLYLLRVEGDGLRPLFLGTQGAGTLVHFGVARVGGEAAARVITRERDATGEQTRVYRWASPGLVEEPALQSLAPAYEHGARPVQAPRFEQSSTAAHDERAPRPRSVRRVDASVPELVLEPTLANVRNRGKFFWVDGEARRQLRRDGFVVVRPPNGPEQFHGLYLQNQYDGIPSYVTSDAVLHVLHLLLDDVLQSVETELLGPVLQQLVAGLLEQGRASRPVVPPALVAPLDRLRLRLSMAAALLEGDRGTASRGAATGRSAVLPASGGDDDDGGVSAAVADELAALEAAAGQSRRLEGVDYRQFVVRGHYTRSEALGRFFKAMLLVGQEVRDPREAALLTALVHAEPAQVERLALLERVVRTMVGPPAALGPLTASAAAREAFGASPEWSALATGDKWLSRSPMAAPRAGAPRFALLPRRWPTDNDLLLAGSLGAELPDPLTLFAALGSVQARARLAATPGWGPTELEGVDEAAAGIREGRAGDDASIGGRLLLALRWLVLPYPQGYPAHQRAAAWADHNLVTAASSWAAWRRDTVLHVQPPIVWMEGAEADALPPGETGFVEPVPELYAELAALTRSVGEMLRATGADARPATRRSPGHAQALGEFAVLLDTLEQAARDELAGHPLRREQHAALGGFGHAIEQLLARDGKLELDPVPVVADVSYVRDPEREIADQVLLVGTGSPDVLVVAISVGTRVLLARGAVGSFYRQVAQAPQSDEQWRDGLRRGVGPTEPVWARPVRSSRAMPSQAPRDSDSGHGRERFRARD